MISKKENEIAPALRLYQWHLSEAKPNVLYEAGYAHALNKPCIHICSTSTEKLPFDVKHWKTTMYHTGQTRKLAQRAGAAAQIVARLIGT